MIIMIIIIALRDDDDDDDDDDLLPKSRNSAKVQGLRNPFYLIPDKPRTTRYKNSFVVYALNNYQ